jgi:hypothetical protein
MASSGMLRRVAFVRTDVTFHSDDGDDAWDVTPRGSY